MKAIAAIWLVPIVALAACANPEIVGRYKVATCKLDGGQPQPCTKLTPTVDVSVASAPSKPPGKDKVTSLPERALGKFIETAGKSKKPSEIAEALGLAIGSSGEDGALPEKAVVSRTFAINVAKTTFNPADRLVFTKVEIRLLGGARFEEWGSVKSEYSEVSLGSIKGTDEFKTAASVKLVPPKADVLFNEGNLSLEQTRSREEQLDYTQKIEALNAWIDNDTATIVRQGIMGVDLTGVTAFDASVSLPPDRSLRRMFYSPKYFVGEGAAKKQVTTLDRLDLNGKETTIPIYKGDIRAKVTLTYGLRHIQSGDGTFEERDDDVLFEVPPPVTKEQVVIPRDTLAKAGWTLQSTENPEKRLYVEVNGTNRRPLCFQHREQASAFKLFVVRLLSDQKAKGATATGKASEETPLVFKGGAMVGYSRIKDVDNKPQLVFESPSYAEILTLQPERCPGG